MRVRKWQISQGKSLILRLFADGSFRGRDRGVFLLLWAVFDHCALWEGNSTREKVTRLRKELVGKSEGTGAPSALFGKGARVGAAWGQCLISVRQDGIKCKAREIMPSKLETASALSVEATVTSKGQITLPKAVRTHLGLRTGSRIRFTLPPDGGFEAHPVLYDLEDLWKLADAASESAPVFRPALTFEEMNQAKARREW